MLSRLTALYAPDFEPDIVVFLALARVPSRSFLSLPFQRRRRNHSSRILPRASHNANGARYVEARKNALYATRVVECGIRDETLTLELIGQTATPCDYGDVYRLPGLRGISFILARSSFQLKCISPIELACLHPLGE